MIAALNNKIDFQRYLGSLKFALYCITHPLDGFWDLTHEKRGTYAAANTILFLTLLIRVLKLRYTSFIFITVYWEDINIFLYIASVLFPLAMFVIGNWGLTTLFDGKAGAGVYGKLLRLDAVPVDAVSADDFQQLCDGG